MVKSENNVGRGFAAMAINLVLILGVSAGIAAAFSPLVA
jgi:hypothetical protein